VPKRAFEDFNTEFEALKSGYMSFVQDLVINYDTYKREMRTDFIAAAKEAYERPTKLHDVEDQVLCLPRTTKGPDGEDVTVSVEITLDQYINEFLDRIEKCYPNQSTIASKFSMDFVAFQMELPDLTEATIDDVAEENQKIMLLQDAFQKKMRKEMEQYAEKIVKENRDRANKVIQALTTNIQKKTRFTETTFNMILNMIETFISLNIVDDFLLEEALKNFKDKYLVKMNAKQIRQSAPTQLAMLEDLTQINAIIQNASEIQALAEAYKAKINM
jgi:hypothetical protein